MTSIVRIFVSLPVLVVLSAIGNSQLGSSACGDDWPQWGGPQRDMVWRESGIVKRLPDGELPRVWQVPVAAGYAGPAVADGRVFVMDRLADEQLERVIAFDAADGKRLWDHSYPAEYTVSYPLGPRATPTIDGDRVYALGAMGDLFCLHVSTGEVIWQKNLPRDFGTELPTWGMAAAPLVDGEQLIVLAGGKPDALVVSLDKETGEERWRALEDGATGYCPPVIYQIGQRRQLIVWHPEAVSALDPENGNVLWEEPFAVNAGLTIALPRYRSDRLFVTAFYDGPLMIDLTRDEPKVQWRTGKSSTEITNDSLHSIMSTPIFGKEIVVGVGSYGEMRALDVRSGEILWETYDATGKGRWWNAFLVQHDDRVFITNEQGELILARLDREGYHEFGRAQLIEPTARVRRRMTVWSPSAYAMRSLFARNDQELIRVDLSAE